MNLPIQHDAALLASVSRSFALSLRALPRSVRGVMSLGYLLARATDSLADASGLPTTARLTALDAFAAHIQGRGEEHPLTCCANAAATTLHPGERQLLERTPALIAALEAQPPDDRTDLRAVLGDIVRGQRLDLVRTSGGRGRFHLESAADLVEYADLVAGSVGAFWTRICLRHVPRCTTLDPETLLGHGRRFGRGLQLVNILRDFPTDVGEGRCYLPAAELRAAGLDPARVFAEPGLARPVFDTWCAEARGLLDSGHRYADALRPIRLRFAVAFPCRLGERTLDAVALRFPEPGVKVPRSAVRRLAIGTLARCLTGRAT